MECSLDQPRLVGNARTAAHTPMVKRDAGRRNRNGIRQRLWSCHRTFVGERPHGVLRQYMVSIGAKITQHGTNADARATRAGLRVQRQSVCMARVHVVAWQQISGGRNSIFGVRRATSRGWGLRLGFARGAGRRHYRSATKRANDDQPRHQPHEEYLYHASIVHGFLQPVKANLQWPVLKFRYLLEIVLVLHEIVLVLVLVLDV